MAEGHSALFHSPTIQQFQIRSSGCKAGHFLAMGSIREGGVGFPLMGAAGAAEAAHPALGPLLGTIQRYR